MCRRDAACVVEGQLRTHAAFLQHTAGNKSTGWPTSEWIDDDSVAPPAVQANSHCARIGLSGAAGGVFVLIVPVDALGRMKIGDWRFHSYRSRDRADWTDKQSRCRPARAHVGPDHFARNPACRFSVRSPRRRPALTSQEAFLWTERMLCGLKVASLRCTVHHFSPQQVERRPLGDGLPRLFPRPGHQHGVIAGLRR